MCWNEKEKRERQGVSIRPRVLQAIRSPSDMAFGVRSQRQTGVCKDTVPPLAHGLGPVMYNHLHPPTKGIASIAGGSCQKVESMTRRKGPHRKGIALVPKPAR